MLDSMAAGLERALGLEPGAKLPLRELLERLQAEVAISGGSRRRPCTALQAGEMGGRLRVHAALCSSAWSTPLPASAAHMHGGLASPLCRFVWHFRDSADRPPGRAQVRSHQACLPYASTARLPAMVCLPSPAGWPTQHAAARRLLLHGCRRGKQGLEAKPGQPAVKAGQWVGMYG